MNFDFFKTLSVTQPVIIYIPPLGELRGGAWVVIDPKINPDYIEMYAIFSRNVISTFKFLIFKFQELLLVIRKWERWNIRTRGYSGA